MTDFAQKLHSLDVSFVSKALGCPIRTVYSWKSGERLPAPWIQKLVVERIEEAARAARNLTIHAN